MGTVSRIADALDGLERYVKNGRRRKAARRDSKSNQLLKRYMQPCCVREREDFRHLMNLNGLLQLRQDAGGDGVYDKSRTLEKAPRDKAAGRAKPAAFGRFLDLPKDVRIILYEEYLADNDDWRLSPYWKPNICGRPGPEFYKPLPPHEPALTFVSRQIREEAVPVFYSMHRFPLVAHFNEEGFRGRNIWYHQLDPTKVAMIRKLELYFCFENLWNSEDWFLAREPRAISYRIDFDMRTGHAHVYVADGQGSVQMQKWVMAFLEDRANRDTTPFGIERFTAENFFSLIPWNISNPKASGWLEGPPIDRAIRTTMARRVRM
jgi:hypothetical protein